MPTVRYDPELHGPRRPSAHGGPGATIEDAAHRFLAGFLADIDDPANEQDVYAFEDFTGRAYMVAGGGPTAYFFVIDGDSPSVFLAYTETAEALVPVPSAWAEQVAAFLAELKAKGDRR